VQLLAGQGFKEVYNLKGGIKAWLGQTATGPQEMGMVYLTGEETPTDIIGLAYGMEEGLRTFYLSMAEAKEDADVVGILSKLAEIEERHKENLFNLYIKIDQGNIDKAQFEKSILPKVMEGGFTTEEFLEQNGPALQTVMDVLNVAMMLETQALDLYLRYSQKTEDKESRTVFHNMADEEKAHLATLGRLMDAKT
jgi:rubrerythrin